MDHRRNWILALALLLASCGGKEKLPNVILITMDTVRADALSSYGSDSAYTPELDKLAEAGVRFQNAQSSSAVTPVSHASILTGKFPYEHGLRVMSADGGFELGPDQVTLAGHFKKAGYRTGAVQSAFPVSRTFGFMRDFDTFMDINGQFQEVGQSAVWDVATLQQRSDTTTTKALEFMDQGEGPFFLWIHYWDPHDDVRVPPVEFIKEAKRLPRFEPTDYRFRTALYGVEVTYQDKQIGRLFQGIKDRGIWENSILGVTSDHGEGLIDGFEKHNWFNHRILYQEQIHVPLIVQGPGVPAGQVPTAHVSTSSLAPTLLQLAGLKPDADQAPSLVSLWESGPAAKNQWVYAEQLNAFDSNAKFVHSRPNFAFLHTISDGDWKLTYRPHRPFADSELYHLSQDPDESENHILDEPEVFERLAEELARRRPWVFEPFRGEGMSELSRSALSNIGYNHAEAIGDIKWWWQCPLHPKTESETGGRCSEADCRFPLLPRNDWKPKGS